MPIQEKLSFSDLPALNSSPDSVRTAFTNVFGTKPDGIALNNETYFNAVTPAITEQYGHPCYKSLGDFSYTVENVQSQPNVVVGYNTATNHGDEEATIHLEVQASWQNELSYSSETTTGLTLSYGFTIEGFFESGMEFSINTTVGESKTVTESKTVVSSIEVTIPPRSKKTVFMTGTLKKEILDFSAPISVEGALGANFPKKVNGHYFWFIDARSALNSTSGTITGKIKNAAIFNIQTEIGKTEPLTEKEMKAFELLKK